MALIVPDTLTRRPRAVPAPRGRPVRLYVCGPTVYDAAHVGHARTYLYFDLARRWLEARGTDVRHVMNITDFEDKITARASELGTTWCALARREERRFLEDLDRLRIRPPHRTPRASEHVRGIVGVISRLDRKHRLERREDGWYFVGPNRSLGPNFEVANELARHAVAEPGVPPPSTKSTAHEFLVWKPQEAPAPSWKSPWGAGMPGWHLECFAMAEEELHVPVDLHGGGRDLIFPHHYIENEVAYLLNHRAFSRTFIHTAFVTAGGTKMAKSTGNLVPLRTALSRFGPDALRWYLLGRPLGIPLEWRDRDAARAREAHRAARSLVRTMLSNGASGNLSVDDLESCVDRMDAALGSGIAADRALDHLRGYLAGVGRRPQPRFAKGERTRARTQVRRIEDRLGLSLI
ncbi:MAG TPA: class I tRNA ligase family protein [Thermoplasmata archaeon]|nr:class I tRNA ligase family protein [Thermoplasmata archaeon]